MAASVLVGTVLDDVNDEVWPVLEQVARAVRVTDAELVPTLDAILRTAVEIVRRRPFGPGPGAQQVGQTHGHDR